jgi:uncharacterized phiE125 gp8 family phage protein
MLRLIEAATTHPVSLADLKTHCNIDQDDAVFDAGLNVYLGAAIRFVSERASLVLAPATYRIERTSFWSGALNVLVTPVRDIKSIVYVDESGVEQSVADTHYRWRRTPTGAELELKSGFPIPPVMPERWDAVQVEVFAGFDDPAATGTGEDPELSLPETAQQAILLLAGHWFENREAVAGSDLASVPWAVDALLAQLKVYR